MFTYIDCSLIKRFGNKNSNFCIIGHMCVGRISVAGFYGSRENTVEERRINDVPMDGIHAYTD